MVIEAKDVRVKNRFELDGDSRKISPPTIFYIGYAHSPTDFLVPADTTGFEIPLTDKGVVKRVRLKNRSGVAVKFNLNGNTDPYELNTQAILTFNDTPTSLTITNEDTENNAVIEVTIVGEED